MDKVLILDFGSQYTQLIARKIRELSVYSEIRPFNISIEEIKAFSPCAIILSGGPASITADGAPSISKKVLELGLPLLGICYGMHLISNLKGGRVVHKTNSQYGPARVNISSHKTLFKNCPEKIDVWMSHGDSVEKLPDGFVATGSAQEQSSTVIAAFENEKENIRGLQFHPEVHHTPEGKKILSNFLDLAGAGRDFLMSSFAETKIKEIKKIAGTQKVLCALSGGVDSSVTARLIQKAIGRNLICVFVNNGVLRKNEAREVLNLYKSMDLNIRYVDASEKFLKRLENISDPEKKRKIIGSTFIEIFEEEKDKIGDISFLAQGTTYPDVIESVSFKGPSVTIKSHHNVGGLPDKMKLKLIEPIRELFKDEVRAFGRELGVPEKTLMRHPFPGPGLAIRIIGPVTRNAISTLQEADAILNEETLNAGLYNKIWQLAALLLPVKTVGVKGDERSYENVIAIRAVESVDGMTADWFEFPPETLKKISNRIINEVTGINRVVYDISSKPPATIEWE